MEAKKSKMCKVRLRRLRPDMADKLKPKRAITKNDIQHSSSSSETEDGDMKVDDEFEKISVKLKSPLALGCNKDFDPYMLLTEAQAALKLCSDEKTNPSLREGNREKLQSEDNITKTEANVAKTNKKPKYSKKQKSQYFPSLEDCSGDGSGSKLRSSIENDIYDLIYYHSDEERSCNNSCNHGRFPSSASALAPIVRRSCSTGSSSSPLSEKCSMRFSKLFENNCISVMDDENPPTALSKILSIKEFDPLAPQQILAIIIKSIVSLAELSQRDDNIVCIDIDKRRILEFSAMSPEEKRNCPLNPYMDVSNIIVTHSDDEFLTFCLCEKCEKYREFVIHIMVEQFKATHMVVMLLDVLIKSYGPMLKNITAYNKFEKLLDSNKEIYWITCGVIYHKKAEHLDFIYDEYLSDNMILVLFSSILMLNNPLLLLQVLAFHIECIVKAYAEGFLEIVEPDKSKIPADEMINYILNGYDDLMRISEQVASYLFAFENDFLRKFSLTWKLLCQRLYQQHVHLHLADTMLACIITLKEEELTSHHTDLIKRYIQFDDVMNYVEKRWTDVWIELNKFNLSEVERKRRNSLLDVYRIFDIVVQDAIGFSLQDSVDDNDFYDFRFLKNRRLAWKNIMSYTKMKWPDGFFQPPNTLVVDDKCATCNVSLDYHADFCKCITCSIAGGPLPPKKNADGKCSKCLAHEMVEKDVNFYDSKIMNVCANDDFQNLVAKSVIGEKGITTALHDVGQELCSTIASVEELINDNDYDKNSEQMIANDNRYHISWAVFNHLNSRKRYPYTTIDENYFCTECKLPSCLLARKILNNKISPSLSQDLIHYYQPLSMSREELFSILPNIMMYNRKLVASNNGLDLIDVHDLVVKIYWIFIISIYATYFIDYDDENNYKMEAFGDDKVKNLENTNEIKNKSLILNALELSNNDIKVNAEKIMGNTDDTKFLEFLDKVKSLSPYNNDVESNFEIGVSSNNSEMQKKINEILNIQNNYDIPPPCDNIPPPIIPSIEEQFQDPELTLSNAAEDQPKKSCKEKFKKCCLDHCEMDDHYKESHSSKKRLKKDCNHARMNETRDRLRKKLSQIVNARKNSNTVQTPPVPHTSTNLASNTSESNNPMDFVPNAEVFPSYLQQQKPPTWDEVHEIVYAFERFHNEAKRNENLQNLCECLQHLQTNSKSETKTCNNIGNKKVQHNHQKKMDHQQLLNDNQPPPQNIHSLEPPNKRSNFSDNSVTEAAISNQTTKIKDNKPTTTSNPSTKSGNDLNFVSEICEIIDSYSKEQTKRSSNENLHNLCECLQQLQTNPKSDSKTQSNKSIKNVHQNNYQNQQKVQEQHQTDINQYPANRSCSSLEPPNKKSNLSNTSTRDASTSSQGTKSKDNNSSNTTIPTPISSSKTTNNLDFVSEICEIIDNYSKEQAKRRWIKETLSFIEGPTAGTGKKKTQPQTLNPKKAAKKAKQKQRKEEEKRIAELQDLRAQFHNIYFKEFSEKLNLKSLKANKKRDKKKIAEVESNIKNLQRAKAKVETAILELIATVKQTNSEFKFSYLPTKEQQLEKLRELESHDVGKNTDKTIKVRNLLHHTTKDSNTVTPTLSSPFTMTPTNNLNMVPESYSMPYAHANHFPYNLGFPTPVASAPFGLMRATPMCYAPPPATALAAAEEQRSLAPDVVAAMASNAATNNTTDPSKRIVTIRRVNLPNVPEPQVTVTAKGSSPDKDKLLYTFINGQLIQTGTAPPINIPQMSAISPLNNQQKQTSTLNSETSSRTHASKLAVENLLTIPPPPPPKLSKTQMKKERKRLAKLQVESSEKVECIRIEKDQREFHQEQKQPKKKKTIMASDQRAKVTCCQSSKEVLNNKNKNKNKLCNSNSTTSVSTNENNESPQLPQMLALKNSAKQKRSDSTTTSCSAVTSPSSNNSTSSQMNTRDNSLSSLKPVDSKPSKNKRSGYVNEPKCNALSKVNTANENKTKSVQQKHNKKQNRISVTPSTTSSETEYDEEEISENKENKLTSASMPQTKKVQLSHTTKLSGINKQKTQSQKTKHIKKPVTLSTSNPESEEEIVQRNHKKRRPKLVDNGQFDNNPFKSLHMQDSETNWSSEEEVDNEEESGNEIDCKRKSALEEKIVMQKSDHKDKHGDESKTSKLNQKSKKNKTQNVSTTPVTENANITSKTSKNNKNTNYQQQIKGSDHPKINNVKNQNRIHDGENRGNSQTRLQRQNMQQNCNSNVRNSKAEIGSKIKTNNKQQTNSSKSHSHTPASSNINNTNSSSSTNNKSQTRNNTRQHSNNNRSTNFSQKITIEQSQHTFQPNNLQSFPSGITENKNQPPKRSQRNKKYQLKSHKHSVNMHHQSCSSSGIPNHMGYFNINEVNIEGAQVQQSPINNSNNNSNQNSTYQSLAEQMQALRLSGGPQVQSNDATPSAQQRHQHINTANVSIMDQLNRGVQVENLSLPPGITLTKVDPIKSEQLRQKSESIKKLAKPLQSQSHLSQNSQAFHHSSMAGSTIIAPPIVNSMASYYGSPYVTATAGIDPQSGIIMVEANPPKNSNVSNKKVTQSTGACNGKQSKNKKRRNKSKAKNLASCPTINSGNNENSKQEVNMGNGQPKMITLRNPMFHNGPTTAPTALLQPQVILPGRPVDGFPIPTPLPVDQPAAIIKNENGMYTIRNPALHQAVTSGLAMGGYRQFGGNVSYYTPQEAAAEAARATRQQQQQQQRHEDNKSSTSLGNTNSSSFSYFSNDVIQANMSHNNINISCTSIGGGDTNAQNHACVNTVGGLSGDAAVIQRPTPQQRPISAIGSEIKNAQQQKQKTITEQQQWTNFGSDTLPLNKNDNLNTSFLGAVTDSASTVVAGSGDMNLQEKYQQSKYYNGFEVFTGSSGGSSSSAATCAHIHHNCGDDSPPPSITGYNSYLEGIPNTGVIRYDDASFLKNLIPGQNLNNEVSIHNVNESNFTRNAQSPTTHHVEITPVYGNRPSSASLYESPAGQTNNANYRGNYRDSLNDYNCVDAAMFSNSNMNMNLNDLDTSMKYDFESTASTSGGTVVCDTSHNTILDFNDLLIQNGPTGKVSHSSSPYLDETTMDGFVQNINSLQISNTSSEEPSSHLGSGSNCARHGTSATTSANPSNGWW